MFPFFLKRLGMVLVMLLLAGGLFAQDDNEAEREREKAEKVARNSYRTRLKRPINGVIFEPDSLQNVPDSMGILRFTRGVHFADSLKSGRFDSAILAMQTIDHGKKVTFNYSNPYDPYKNPTYYRRGQGKVLVFWIGDVFVVGVHVLPGGVSKAIRVAREGCLESLLLQ
jgi:hypothetical protein